MEQIAKIKNNNFTVAKIEGTLNQVQKLYIDFFPTILYYNKQK